MLKVIDVFDGATDRQVAVLSYETVDKRFSMSINNDINPALLPLSLEIFAGTGTWELTHNDVMLWIRGRICPPGRQNINTILSELGLPEYDEYGLLMYTKARCDKDELYIVENMLINCS